jgi:hypothetical protein
LDAPSLRQSHSDADGLLPMAARRRGARLKKDKSNADVTDVVTQRDAGRKESQCTDG